MQKKDFTAAIVLEANNTLGEAPLWHAIHQILYWVDIEEKVVHGYEPHTRRHREWPVFKRAGTVAPASNGNLILGLQGEIAELDLSSGKLSTLLKLEPEFPRNRCNDGKCDPFGRFWVGTMHLENRPGTGSLYCIATDLHAHTALTDLTIANGMAWSPEGDWMYFIDSADKNVRRYRFSADRVALDGGEVVLQFEDGDGTPDGLCVDVQGMAWIGFWGGSRVGRYDLATGQHLADVHVPAPHVTSCTFGGKDMETLYITTARDGLSQTQLTEFPRSGSLFSCEVGLRGLDANVFERGKAS